MLVDRQIGSSLHLTISVVQFETFVAQEKFVFVVYDGAQIEDPAAVVPRVVRLGIDSDALLSNAQLICNKVVKLVRPVFNLEK